MELLWDAFCVHGAFDFWFILIFGLFVGCVSRTAVGELRCTVAGMQRGILILSALALAPPPVCAGEAKLCVRVKRSSLTLGLGVASSVHFRATRRAIVAAMRMGFKEFY